MGTNAVFWNRHLLTRYSDFICFAFFMCWHNTSTSLELGALLMLANANRSVLGGINKAFQMVSYKDWSEKQLPSKESYGLRPLKTKKENT